MQPAINDINVYTDFSGFEKLKLEAKNNSEESLKKVAAQFESLFIQMLMKNMRDASLAEGIFDSDTSKFYREMYDQQLSVELTKRNSIGLADMLVRQLSQSQPSSIPGAGNIETDFSSGDGVQKVSMAKKGAGFASPESFVRELLPHAREAAKKLGVEPRLLLAQAALETGWGKYIMSDGKNSSSHNLFGIKALRDWDGDVVYSETIEFQGKNAGKAMQPFRVYESYSQSFNDYADFLESHPRYRKVLESSASSDIFIRNLQNAGYATDPEYADKVLNILNKKIFSVERPAA